jgi:hypothetical protein
MDTQSYEAKKLNEAIESCQARIASADVDGVEKQAMAFYLTELKQITSCADKDRFRKFAMGIGGSGDTEVIKPYVVRNHQTNKPLQKSDGSLVVIKCVFTDVDRYLITVMSGKAETLRRSDGVWAFNDADQQKYAAPDPYAYAFQAAFNDRD